MAMQNHILARSDRLFAELWDNSPDGMLLINEQGEILAVNQAFSNLVKLPKEALIGRPFTVVYHEKERPELLERFDLFLAGGMGQPWHEAQYQMWYGSKLWLEFSHSLLSLPQFGKAVLTIVKDITARKKVLFDLADSEKRFRTLFNNANDPAFVAHLDENQRFENFIEVNQSACETYLYSREEFMRLTPLVLIPPEYMQKELSALETLQKSGHVIYEMEHFRKDKRRIPVEISAHLFEYKNRPTVLSIVRDISERKRVQRALQLSREQLRNLASRLHDIREEERSMIAREIHDELGQLLTVLKIEISLLCKKFIPDHPDIDQRMKTISGLINQAVESVQQISSKLRPGILDELGLVAAIEWQAQEFSKHTGIQCRYSLTNETLELDRDKSTAIFRIFQEALTNVARHAEAQRVSVFLKKEARHVILEITDNGTGINRQQIENPRSLGILGMRERALVFGGTVSIRGVKGKGTHVKVVMPL
jgi:two-component system sensor histidine kinase UhpB